MRSCKITGYNICASSGVARLFNKDIGVIRIPMHYLRAAAVQKGHRSPNISEDLYPLKVSWILSRDEVQQSLTLDCMHPSQNIRVRLNFIAAAEKRCRTQDRSDTVEINARAIGS